MTSLQRFIRLAGMLLLLLGVAGTRAVAQESSTVGSITISGYACPRGMTAETLDPAQCDPVPIPSISLVYDNPESTSPSLTDMQSGTWPDLPLSSEGPTEFLIVLRAGIYGYHQSTFTGDHLTSSTSGVAHVELTTEEPSADIQFYFLMEQDPIVDLRVVPLTCPSVDADFSECESPGGVEIAVAVDGQELDGSPMTTRYNQDIGWATIGFQAPFF
ncbi:MAG: hypothetical protein IT336_03090 [Thermomicrobiales bacterium]|nr:hypothetical protein [Thermomicrobiales bacterium]